MTDLLPTYTAQLILNFLCGRIIDSLHVLFSLPFDVHSHINLSKWIFCHFLCASHDRSVALQGLEFDDVFLLDFFADSPANTEWRVLLTYLEEMVPQGATEVRVKLSIMEVSVVVTVDLMAGAQLRQGDCKNLCMHGLHSAAQVDMEAEADLRPLRFDPLRHGMLCEELKHLYTAITRAKNNVIIFDSNPKKRAPFFQYLQRLNLARVVRR